MSLYVVFAKCVTHYFVSSESFYRQMCPRSSETVPYLFWCTVSPCHELTSWDNSSSMSIWLGRKESHCEDILPVSSTDGAAISPTISLALSLRYTRKCEKKRKLISCSIAPCDTEKHKIKISKLSLNCKFFFYFLYGFWYFYNLIPPPPPHPHPQHLLILYKD